MNTEPGLPPAPIWRRFAAAGYDFLLLAALWMAGTALFITIYGLTGLPMDDAGGVDRPSRLVLQWGLFPFLVVLTWAFFAWFWLHGGQTLGMRAWRLVTRDRHHGPMKVRQTVSRFCAGILSWALLGAGYLAALVAPFQTLHDRLSGTETVLLPGKEK